MGLDTHSINLNALVNPTCMPDARSRPPPHQKIPIYLDYHSHPSDESPSSSPSPIRLDDLAHQKPVPATLLVISLLILTIFLIVILSVLVLFFIFAVVFVVAILAVLSSL